MFGGSTADRRNKRPASFQAACGAFPPLELFGVKLFKFMVF